MKKIYTFSFQITELSLLISSKINTIYAVYIYCVCVYICMVV